MRVTGIVRYIDDLGRIVIPKDIRRRYRFGTGDAVEFFIEDDGTIIIKKYEPESVISDKVDEIMKDFINSFDSSNPRQRRAFENLRELQEMVKEKEI